jgi:hypothetical protein
METRLTLLKNITYRPSYALAKDRAKFKRLETAGDWYQLVKETNDWRTKQKAKNRNAGKVDPFHIEISEKRSQSSKADLGKKDDAKGKKKTKERKVSALICDSMCN